MYTLPACPTHMHVHTPACIVPPTDNGHCNDQYVRSCLEYSNIRLSVCTHVCVTVCVARAVDGSKLAGIYLESHANLPQPSLDTSLVLAMRSQQCTCSWVHTVLVKESTCSAASVHGISCMSC